MFLSHEHMINKFYDFNGLDTIHYFYLKTMGLGNSKMNWDRNYEIAFVQKLDKPNICLPLSVL